MPDAAVMVSTFFEDTVMHSMLTLHLDSCLDTVARRECNQTCNSGAQDPQGEHFLHILFRETELFLNSQLGRPGSTSPRSKATPENQRRPCDYHTKTTRKRYAEKLEALGCICRVLLSLNQESCCSSTSRWTREKKGRKNSLHKSPSQERLLRRSTSSLSSQSTRSAKASPQRCMSARNGCGNSLKRVASGESGAPYGSCKVTQNCASSCCQKTQPEISCCGENETSTGSHDKSTITKPLGIFSPSNSIDLERGGVGSEHVILSVTGMTCTGCESMLQRALSSTDSIANPKTSLIFSRAEFDVDLSIRSVSSVIEHLERVTGFTCEKVENEIEKCSEIDILPDDDVNTFIDQPLPPGVLQMTPIGKRTVRVFYDPTVVGGRDLLNGGFKGTAKLAPPGAEPSVAAGNRHVRRVGWITLLSTLLTIPVLVMAWAPIPEHPVTYGAISLACATIIQVFVAGPFYPRALKSLIFARMIEMDLLIVMSTSAAYIFSVVSFGYLVNGNPLSTGEFFETSTLLVTLIMVGRFVSALARQKAVESISIRSLQSSTAVLVGKDGKTETEIDARLLQYGDIFKVSPDSRVVTDGTVISGHSEVDESMVTGESKLVEKTIKSAVIAGSVNGSGALTVRLNRLPGDNTISAIAGMVDEAKFSKPKTQEIADRVASYFVPVVVFITIITFISWVIVGVRVRGQSGSEAAIQAITYAITVLIVSCPCAIGLAVPMVIAIAGGVAAEHGVIFKTADTIELARKVTHVIFDKTGTLTRGKLSVLTEEYPSGDRDTILPILLGLVSGIKHPVSAAVTRHLQGLNITAAQLDDIQTITSKGVQGTYDGQTIRAGNSRWLGLESHPRVSDFLSTGCTVFCVEIDGVTSAIFGLEDTLRSDAQSTINELIKRNIEVSIVSGDDEAAVQSVGSQLGVPPSNVRARCNPGDKQEYIKSLAPTEGGPKANPPTTLFIGDGTNDAVALTQATIGVHVSEGTDLAQSAADVVLMRSSLSGILFLMDLSKAAMHRVVFNFAWSFLYNIFAVVLAAGAFVTFRIPPEFAGLGELVSVLPVILAAMFLKWVKFQDIDQGLE